MNDDWREIREIVARALAPAGLDLVQPLRAGRYDAAVDRPYRLPDFPAPRGPDRLAIVIGNSGAIWAPFLAALRADPARIDRGAPLDRWVAEHVYAAAAALPVRAEVRLAHEAPPRRIAMQRLAHVSGLAPLGPAHLNVHPRYGPWIALRAAIVADTAGPPDDASAELPEPCRGCDCAARLAAATAPRAGGWAPWLALRDACTVGREHRYSDDQIAYHYEKDPALLRRILFR